jgi:hypothetical protein
MTILWLLLPWVAEAPDPADVKQGWLGFAVFVALAVAVVLLWLSMRRHLKKVDFEEEPDPPGEEPTATTDTPEREPGRPSDLG